MSESSLSFVYKGDWATYNFTVDEQTEVDDLLIVCEIPFTLIAQPFKKGSKKKLKRKNHSKIIPIKKVAPKLLELFNWIQQDYPLGKFCYMTNGEAAVMVAWSYRTRLSIMADYDVLQTILEEAQGEVDEYYPSIALVLTGDTTAYKAYTKAIPTTLGRA